jgi:hypothetical protein
MENKRKNILIHPDHIEDLDKKYKRLEENRKEPVRTGYTSICRLRNTRLHRDILFRRMFVRDKMPTGAFIIFKELGKDSVMLQPCKPEWMNRTHINHVGGRFLGCLRFFSSYADLDTTPPSQILYDLKIDPLVTSYTFRLEEWKVQDEHDGVRGHASTSRGCSRYALVFSVELGPERAKNANAERRQIESEHKLSEECQVVLGSDCVEKREVLRVLRNHR